MQLNRQQVLWVEQQHVLRDERLYAERLRLLRETTDVLNRLSLSVHALPTTQLFASLAVAMQVIDAKRPEAESSEMVGEFKAQFLQDRENRTQLGTALAEARVLYGSEVNSQIDALEISLHAMDTTDLNFETLDLAVALGRRGATLGRVTVVIDSLTAELAARAQPTRARIQEASQRLVASMSRELLGRTISTDR